MAAYILRRKYLAMIFLILFPFIIYAQHDHNIQNKESEKDTLKEGHTEHKMEAKDDLMNIKKGSGTSSLPQDAPMYGYMMHTNNWMLMFHGNLFLRNNSQDLTGKGNRGDDQFDAPNWFMVMAENQINGSNIIKLSLMLSLDPLLVGGSGYPLLFQSGESYEGQPLVDRQHPHDLISELSIEYNYLFSQNIGLIAYLGYSGEPALGPVAFMHRPSAINNPDSPLGHHWQDATHITFGIATLGFRIYNYQIEGSIFTGREPNEDRYNFDEPKFDSYSLRISTILLQELSLQTSYAFIKSPELLNQDENVKRTTASILHSKKFSGNSFLNSALIWGFNYVDAEHQEHSATLEMNYDINKFSVYGRYEWIEKSAEELSLEEFGHDEIFTINALTLGTAYSIFNFAGTKIQLGLHGSIFAASSILDDVYGKNPLSFQVYLRVSPGIMNMH